MKSVKRNAVIITVMLFVCAAVYLNWSYNREVEEASHAGQGGDMETLEEKKETGTPEEPEKSGDKGSGGAQTLQNVESPDAGLYYSVAGTKDGADSGEDGEDEKTDSQTGEYDEYFAQVRLERTQARDEAAATLNAVAAMTGASQESVDGAVAAMTRLAENAVKEVELENLIKAKGFIDCVVYLTDDGATVTVASEEGLTEASAARITDVIVSKTGLTADKLNVIEIK